MPDRMISDASFDAATDLTALTLAGVQGGANVRVPAETLIQPLSANLTTLAAVTPGATGLALLDDTTAAAARTTISAQASSANLTTLAAVTPGATGLALLDDTTAAGALTTLGVSAFVQNALDDTDAATFRATISAQESNANLTTLAGVTPGSKGLAILADTTSDAVHEELARDWSGATASAPTLSVPNVMQRRYIDVGAYCSLTDTNDAHAGIQAAFDDADGREIVFTNPLGSTRYYRSLTRPAGASATTGVLTMPNRGRIIMEPGAILDLSDWANSGNVKYYLYAKATDPTAVNLSSNAAIEDDEIVLTDGSSFAAGDDIIIVSNAFFTTEDGSTGTKGEWAFVTGVSGNTLTVAGRLRDTYNTADTARVFRMNNVCSLTLEGINLIGCGRFSTDVVGDRGIWIENGKDCHIIGGSVSYSDQLSISMVNILNGSVDGTAVRFGAKVSDAVNQYGPHFVNLCENVHFKNLDITGGKEASGLTSTGGIQGVTRDCSITYSRMRGAWRSGCATHDNHTGFVFSNNVVEDCEQGVDNRIIGGTYQGNVFRRLGAYSGTLSCGLQLGSGAQKVLFEGNTIEDASRGVYMPDSIVHEVAPGDIDIINNDMRNISTYGVLIENEVGNTDALGTVTVVGNRFEGDGVTAMRGVEIEGKWKALVANNTMRNGNAGRSVYLHATMNGSGETGTAQAGTNNTITLAAGASASLPGSTITIVGGTGSGQSRTVDSYDNGTKVVTVTSNWTTNPDSTSQYAFPIAGDGPVNGMIVNNQYDSTFTEPLVQHETSATKVVEGNRKFGTLSTGLSYMVSSGAATAAHTGNTDETELASVSIPANMMGPNGWIEIDVTWGTPGGSANAKTGIVKYNGSSGTTYYSVNVTTALSLRAHIIIQNRNSTSSQAGGAATALAGGFGSSTSAVPTSAIDTTAARTISFKGDLANAADSILVERYSVKVFYHP